MRVRQPDIEGTIERSGVRVGYDVYADGEDRPWLVLLPSWAIVHMRQWKLQVPYLSRYFRVITVDRAETAARSVPPTLPPYGSGLRDGPGRSAGRAPAGVEVH